MTITVNRRPERQPEKTLQDAPPHPSRGGRAYSHDTRVMAIAQTDAGLLNGPEADQLRAQHRIPSKRTIRGWKAREQALGTFAAFRPNGGHRSRILRGIPFYLLAKYRAAFPQANHAEIRAHLFNAYGRHLPVPRFYNNSEIVAAEKRLELSRKKGSTTARQASLPQNQVKRYRFWHLPYPHGIADIRREDMIDIDEAGIKLEHAKRSYGKAVTGQRVREEGPYGHEGKLTLLMAVAGRPGPNDRFYKLEERPGTDVLFFYEFIREIIDAIGPGTPGNRRCFTMDNLNAHKHPLVLQLIYMSGHRYAFRAPYHPVDGPIEYVFDTIEHELSMRKYQIYNLEDTRQATIEIINSIVSFENYFINVGFTN